MPDPTLATVGFLSWVRQGLAARSGVANAVSLNDGHLSLPVSLRLNDTKLADVPVQLYGPGDVIGFDAREVVRTEPQNMMSSFEPNYFPFIEFDHPDFPWMFTPASADAMGRLLPWLCLIVVRKENATLNMDPTKLLPVLDCPQQELPDLSEAWAWAHAQITTSAAVPGVNDALTKRDRNISRLLSPRRLDEATAYYACVIPTFEVGRKAGMGESFTVDDEEALRPAWVATAASGTANRVQLPVYHHWEFSTGVEGDFEALARRLQPQDLPAGVGVIDVDVSTPGWGVGPFPKTASGAVIEMEGALRNPVAQAATWRDSVRLPFQAALRQILDTSAKPASEDDTPPVVGPPLYGQWYTKLDRLTAAGGPPWFSEVNLEVRFRIAAGLGAQVVRFEQEDLMAAAWNQLANQATDNNRLKQAQLAEEVGQTFVDKHLAQLSPVRFLQVTAPIHAAVVRSLSEKSSLPQTGAVLGVGAQRVAGSTPSLGGPETSAAYRRITRARGPIARRVAERSGGTVPNIAQQRAVKGIARAATPFAPAGARATNAFMALRNAATDVAGFKILSPASLKSHVLGQLNPHATALAAVQQQSPGAQTTDLLRFAPSFTQPMYEALRDFFSDMLLPGLDKVPPNSITLLETNPQFVEAFLLGLNHEMSRELFWRGYPTDRRGTYFRQFWDVSGRVPAPTPQERSQLADIRPVDEWLDGSVGDHPTSNTSALMIVLALRGDLLNRYPRAIIYAVQALWSSAAQNATRNLGTKELYPMFRVTRAPDITMLGFAITARQARGADVPTAAPGAPATPSDDAGWFFVLQEQPTEPRFGLDGATDETFGTTPSQWSDLSWGNLAPSAAALKQIVYVPIDGLLKSLTLGNGTWGNNSAHMAFIVRRSPFRLAVHARTWLRQ